MAKKSKSKRTQSSLSEAQTSSGRYSLSEKFDPDYSYIIQDLKRIGILAGTFFIILIGISFFI